MRMVGFTADASLQKTSNHYQAAAAVTSTISPRLLPQQIVPPGLYCVFDYWACNSNCSTVPIWRRGQCYSYCYFLYDKCLHPVPVPQSFG